VRTCRRLWVILNAKCTSLKQLKPLDDAIVETEMGYLTWTEDC
jgi:hypothetical protein